MDEYVEKVLDEIGALATNLDHEDSFSHIFLEAYANVVSSFITHGYRDEAEQAINDICDKAEECGLSDESWVKTFRKKAGLFENDEDDDDENGEEDSQIGGA